MHNQLELISPDVVCAIETPVDYTAIERVI
jgi:hypothetical protein